MTAAIVIIIVVFLALLGAFSKDGGPVLFEKKEGEDDTLNCLGTLAVAIIVGLIIFGMLRMLFSA